MATQNTEEFDDADAVVNVKKGLEGVCVDVTAVSKVMPDINALVYRGYPVQDLAESCTFEEVAYLLLHDDLPSKSQLAAFCQKERSYRALSPALQQTIKIFPKNAHPMDTVRTGVSFLGMEDSETLKVDRAKDADRAVQLLARIPTIIASDFRFRRKGKEPIAPRTDLSMAENLFHMCFGEVPDKAVVKAFDVSLILYAEHSFNASTFAARVITSTMADLFSTVTGAIGALKGPLHGGANEQVMHMMEEIADPAKARDWLLTALKEKRKVMGFGHRVYRKGDSRVPTMKKYMLKLSEAKHEMKWAKMYEALEKTMVEAKNIHPHLDFPAGPAYFLMGFDIDFFTPIFVMSRITGWSAHYLEQAANNRLIRPLSQYVGAPERKVKPLADR